MLTRPRISNLRFIPENQTEPDDDTSLEFDLVNDAEFSVEIRLFRFELVPAPNSSLPFPGLVTSLLLRTPPGVKVFFICNNLEVIGERFTLAPRSSAKLAGVLTTKSSMNPKAMYPFKFNMNVTFDWAMLNPVDVAVQSKRIANVIVDD